MSGVERELVNEVRTMLSHRLGLALDTADPADISEPLQERMKATGMDTPAEYLRLLRSPQRGEEEVQALADHITVGETFFFRQREHYEVLRHLVLPERIRARGSDRRLRFLSAGCSSGEEPYTVAMVLDDAVGGGSQWNLTIDACDVSSRFERARERNVFSEWALRETPDAMRARYFRRVLRGWALDRRILEAVSFRRGNLADPSAVCWQAGEYDAIFCRNVLMYLEPDHARAVVARLAKALVPGGYLFLGHAETLRGLSQDFDLRRGESAFYYQLRSPEKQRSAAPMPRRAGATAEPSRAVAAESGSWVEAIAAAAARVSNLRRSLEPTSDGVGLATARRAPLELVMDLLTAERFGEALAVLRGLPDEVREDIDTQLLVAVTLTNQGMVDEAEEVCRKVLDLDGLNAGAHYLLALCREHRGDTTAAMEADRAAIHLDPEFAMPRLHLGLLHKRSGEVGAARRELQKARVLLPMEDSSRILLFGGGFNRSALVRLCDAQLQSVGGTG